MGKRGNGEGSVYPIRNKEGRVIGYRATYHVETTDGTKRRYVRGKTRKEAKEKLADVIVESKNGMIFDFENQTMSEFLNRWLDDSVKDNVAHRTFHNYHSQVKNHINPMLGRVKLKNLSPAHVQSFYRSMLDKGLSGSSVRYAHAVLRRALGQAVKWSLIPRNVCEAVDPPKVQCEEITPLSREEPRKLLDVASRSSDRFETLYVVALACGLRQGELLGLKWSDIDLDTRALRVNRQLQRHRGGGGLVFSEPKNASRRNINLPSQAVDALKRQKVRQAEEKLKAGPLYEERDLVFASEYGTPLDAQNVVNRSFKPLLKKAELPDIRFHDLRHTCATLLLSKGVHPKYVQNLLGHASIKITLDLYSHWMPGMGEQTAAAMEEALG